MLTHNRLYPHLSYETITDVEQVINNHLKDDWLIRIEYTDEVKYLNTSWQQWGKSFFKIKSPAEVVDGLFACHISNQFCSIRLHAEKTNPVINLYYSVCQACPVSKELGSAPAETVDNDVNL